MGEKIGYTIFLFIVIFVAGLFGQHLGYTVHGVPHGSSTSEITDWRDADYGFDVVFAFFKDKFKDNAIGTGVEAFEYLWNFAAFQIDNTPFWLTGFCDLCVLIALLVIWMLIRGN